MAYLDPKVVAVALENRTKSVKIQIQFFDESLQEMDQKPQKFHFRQASNIQNHFWHFL